MVMQRRDLDATLCQLLHYRADFVLGKNEIAHDHRDIAHRRKRKPRAERKRRLELDAVERDVRVGTR
jgi:hypothetical protein